MQPRIDSSVVLPLPDGPIRSVSSPGTSVRLTPLTARHLAGAGAQILDDVDGFEDRLFAHLLNTVAGSIFVTLTIADKAEMAHMPTVSVNNQNAKPGVMTRGKALFLLSTKTRSAIDMPSA